MSLIVTVVAVSWALAQADSGSPPAGSSTGADQMKSLNAFYLQEASRYDFFRDSARQQKLTLQTQPLMHWGLFDDWSGAVYVWTYEGRPELIGCVGSGLGADKRRNMFHEFQSLAEKPLATTRIDGARRWVWTPEAAGIRFQEVPEAPAPASSPAQRNSQMRLLSRQFSGYMTHGDERPLRLLPQPLYQYGGAKGSPSAGAIFAFAWADGTDPELLLLLESRAAGSGSRWHYASARFTQRALRLEHQKREVWRVAEYREQWQTTQLKQSYLTVWIRWVNMDQIQAAVDKPSAKE